MEQLKIQPEAFQKEFNLFLKSKNVPERITSFKELLKSIFKIDEIYQVYKKTFEAEWEELLPEKKTVLT